MNDTDRLIRDLSARLESLEHFAFGFIETRRAKKRAEALTDLAERFKSLEEDFRNFAEKT